MKASTLIAKMSGLCTRPYCFEEAAADNCMCTVHAADAAARVRRSTTKLRAQRRAAGQCAACGRPSTTYRCTTPCERRQPELSLTMEGR